MLRKNFSKKIAALAVSVVLSVMSCMSVFASYIHEIGYSSEPCPRCGDTTIWVKEEYKDPSPTGAEQFCTHHRFGTDLEMDRRTVISYDCHECNYGWTEEEHFYYWQCCGFDMP